jgi:hypothetical protein
MLTWVLDNPLPISSCPPDCAPYWLARLDSTGLKDLSDYIEFKPAPAHVVPTDCVCGDDEPTSEPSSEVGLLLDSQNNWAASGTDRQIPFWIACTMDHLHSTIAWLLHLLVPAARKSSLA